jgi:hypothetical protein
LRAVRGLVEHVLAGLSREFAKLHAHKRVFHQPASWRYSERLGLPRYATTGDATFSSVTRETLSAPMRKRKTRHLIEITGFILVAGGRDHQNLRSRNGRPARMVKLLDTLAQFRVLAAGSPHLNLLFSSEA